MALCNVILNHSGAATGDSAPNNDEVTYHDLLIKVCLSLHMDLLLPVR